MSNDLFGDEPDEERDAFEARRMGLAAILDAFAEAEDIDDEYVSVLLLDAAIGSRSVAYVASVEKPSEGGLKLELDRFGRAFGDLLRVSKKEAGRIVRELRESMAEAEKSTPVREK